ncbi:hypothetical protein JHK82_034999 [Glycine max]|nr:hypothetical protein JHK85_035714 [Glycine max]KAG5111730.1 hypothetical protein JHK82_034999 [Glycine max]
MAVVMALVVVVVPLVEVMVCYTENYTFALKVALNFKSQTISVKEIQHPEIPSNVYMITLFVDIISGVAPRYTLVVSLLSFSYNKQFHIHFSLGLTFVLGGHFGQDIVGVVADLIDVKTINPPHRMTVRLKDNSNSDIIMTVWEYYIVQLHDAIDKNLLLQEPLIVLLSLGKIKDAIVDKIIIDAPWSYDSCPYCTTTFDPSKVGSACRSCQNRVRDTVPR